MPSGALPGRASGAARTAAGSAPAGRAALGWRHALPLFDQTNLELQSEQTFALQNPQLLRVHLGGDVLAVKGAMVAYQGQMRFDHEKAGSMGKLLKKVVTGEDVSLMRVSGDGEVFFASEAGFVHLIELTGDGISVNARNLLAFDSSIAWDIKRVQGAGMMSGGLFNTTLEGAARSPSTRWASPSSSSARSSRPTSTSSPASAGPSA